MEHAGFPPPLLQEGRAAALLDHPNVVRVLEADTTDSAGYIASAYCEGPSLAVWLRERKEPLPCRLAAALTADLAAGVHHAHERGVVHRDLKPANVLLEIGSESDAAGLPRRITPKICDFGLAKMLEGEQTQTRAGGGDGHAAVHGAGAGRGADGRHRPGRRRVRAGRGAVRDADRPAAVRRRAGPGPAAPGVAGAAGAAAAAPQGRAAQTWRRSC